MFGDKLKILREEKNLTQGELANILNISRQAISNWENAGREPSLETLIKIADYFNVSLDYLLDRTQVRYFFKTDSELENLTSYIKDCIKVYHKHIKRP